VRAARCGATNCSTVCAAGSNASILPRSDFHSASVSSLVRHSALAARRTPPFASYSPWHWEQPTSLE